MLVITIKAAFDISIEELEDIGSSIRGALDELRDMGAARIEDAVISEGSLDSFMSSDPGVTDIRFDISAPAKGYIKFDD